MTGQESQSGVQGGDHGHQDRASFLGYARLQEKPYRAEIVPKVSPVNMSRGRGEKYKKTLSKK
jgi:hypothetical protein